MSRRTPTTEPWSARIDCHASVRIRYVTKNGAMMRRSRKFFHRPPRNAIQYASGYEMRNAASVASAAYWSERMKWLAVERERVGVVVPGPGERVAVERVAGLERRVAEVVHRHDEEDREERESRQEQEVGVRPRRCSTNGPPRGRLRERPTKH